MSDGMDRRSFLRGTAASAACAAALGLGVASTAFGQQPPPQEPPKKDDAPPPKPETKTDKDGREYRVCPQCGFNMYRQDRTWTCENCGYSYVE